MRKRTKEEMRKIAEAMNEYRKSLKLRSREFARRINTDPSYVSSCENGRRAPGFDLIKRMKEEFGRAPNLDFSLLREADVEYEIEGKEFISIPQMSDKINAGGGLLPQNSGQIEIHLAFRKDWVIRKGSPDRMSLIKVVGDSMEPTLYPDDIVLVDHDRNYIEGSGGIYAIVFFEHIVIKRLQAIYPSKKIRVISDNPKYDPIEVEQDSLFINGKVIWFGREIEK